MALNGIWRQEEITMFEINTNLAYSWSTARQNVGRKPHYLNISCPYCGTSLANRLIREAEWSTYSSSLYLTRLPCAACENSAFLFLIYPEPLKDPDDLNGRLFLYPGPSLAPKLPEEVKTLSPRFVQIYEQALNAEHLNLDELAGMGYRKALEILIKDYAIEKNPDDAEKIKQRWLMSCIEDYVSNPNLQATARKTTILGNDQSHYERRSLAEDLIDLKKFLHATLLWMELEIETSRLQNKS